MIQNVWNRQNRAEEYEENFLVLRLFDAARSRFPYEQLKSLNVLRVDCHDLFFSFQIEVFFSRESSFTNLFSCSLNIQSGL